MKKLVFFVITLLCVAGITACSYVSLEPLPSLPSEFGTLPDEGITIDGAADEEIWQSKNYFSAANAELNAGFHVTTHLTENGVYVFAYSDDSSVCYSSRNIFENNTHFYFIITALGDNSLYNDAYCRSIKLDAGKYSMPTNFNYVAATSVNGTVNGKTRGLSAEIFIGWDQLGVEPVTQVKIYSAYNYVARTNAAGSYIANAFSENDPDTYQLYGKDGYCDQSQEGLGQNDFGMSLTGGFRRDGDALINVGGGMQTAFFPVNSSNFIAEATFSPTGKIYRDSKIAKAGIVLYKSDVLYRSVMLDFREQNTTDGVFKSTRLYTVTDYPNQQTRTTICYSGSDGVSPTITLKVIKQDQYLYYLINGELVATEQLPWLSDNVSAGICAQDAGVKITDWNFIDCTDDTIALDDAIESIACRIEIDQSPDYILSASNFAVAKGGEVDIEIVVRTGYTLKKLFNNGVDITAEAERHNEGGTITLYNVTEDMFISAEVEAIEEAVSIHGTVSDPDGYKLPYAMISATGFAGGRAYYTTADKDGNYSLEVDAGDSYEVTVSYDNYRDTTLSAGKVDIDCKLDLRIENYVVGGSVESSDGSWRVSSNISAWDMSNESENTVVLDSQDRLSRGDIYFTGISSENVFIEVTVTNLTDPNIGVYESDPGAGICVTQKFGGATRSAYYMLYRAGYRVRPTGSYTDGTLVFNGAVTDSDIRDFGRDVKLTFVRLGDRYFMFIDEVLAYAGVNDTIVGEAAYGLSADSASTIMFKYSDYSILSGNDAVAAAEQLLYARFIYDHDELSITGEDFYNDIGLYDSTVTITVKDLTGSDVAILTVNDEVYCLSRFNDSLRYTVSGYTANGLPDISLDVKRTTGSVAKGKVNVKSVVTAKGSAFKAVTETDSSGNWQFYLPDGEYAFIAVADGYEAAYVTDEIQSGGTANIDINLEAARIGESVTLRGNVLRSGLGYSFGFNEDLLRNEVKAVQSANGNAVYFSETAADVAVKFSFTKVSGSESDPGFGIWFATADNPAETDSVRFLFKSNMLEIRDRAGSEIHWDRTAKLGDIYVNNGTYDALVIRKENTYSIYLRESGIGEYIKVYSYVSDTISGVSAIGLCLSAMSPIDARFFYYSLITDAEEIDALLSTLE